MLWLFSGPTNRVAVDRLYSDHSRSDRKVLLLTGNMYPTIALSLGLFVVAAPPDVPRAVREGGLAATVRVSDPSAGSVGTGVVIGVRKGFVYVLTAAHVLGPDAKPQVEPLTGPGAGADGAPHDSCELVFRAAGSDVAVVRLPAGKRDWPAARLAPTPAAGTVTKAGWSIGCDDGKVPRVEAVTLVGRKLVKKDGAGAFFWEARGETVRGRSGGPLLDADGRLIGVCSGTQEGMSYYAHPNEIRSALDGHNLKWVLAEVEK
jgi:S1-C subfamily serine protease